MVKIRLSVNLRKNIDMEGEEIWKKRITIQDLRQHASKMVEPEVKESLCLCGMAAGAPPAVRDRSCRGRCAASVHQPPFSDILQGSFDGGLGGSVLFPLFACPPA